jgi:hypothetical protein
MIRLASWNMAHQDYWSHLQELDLDLAVLQEVAPQPGRALEVWS